jgi:hypothetical protein
LAIVKDYIPNRLKNLLGNAYLNRLFLNNGKKAKCCLLAPIAVEILVAGGSGNKIETESGTILPEKA